MYDKQMTSERECKDDEGGGKVVTGRRLLREEGQPRPMQWKSALATRSILRDTTYLSQLPLVLLHQCRVNLNLGRLESWRSDELKAGVTKNRSFNTCAWLLSTTNTNPTSFLASHKNGFSKL